MISLRRVFPVPSEGDFDAVRQIAKEIKKTQVAGLARANKLDIDRAWQAIKERLIRVSILLFPLRIFI